MGSDIMLGSLEFISLGLCHCLYKRAPPCRPFEERDPSMYCKVYPGGVQLYVFTPSKGIFRLPPPQMPVEGNRQWGAEGGMSEAHGEGSLEVG